MLLSVRLVENIRILFFFFNDTATTEIYTLSLHDALPIYAFFLTRSFFVVKPGFLAVKLGFCEKYVYYWCKFRVLGADLEFWGNFYHFWGTFLQFLAKKLVNMFEKRQRV